MSEKKRPVRTCIACRSSNEKKELLRIVKTADGLIEIDPTGKKSGRGAYVCRSTYCVSSAAKKKAFARALRTAVPAEFVDELMRAVQESEDRDS